MGLEMGPLSSPGMTSYRLHSTHSNYWFISHRFRSALDVSDRETDRQTDGIVLAKDGTKHQQ